MRKQKFQKANPDDFFSIAHLESNLKDHSIKSATVTLIAQVLKAGLQLGFIAIFSRLLAPTDFGLVAMITIFTSLGMTMMDGGLSMATIQKEKITNAQVSNLFWVNLALGLSMAVLATLISPVVGWIYEEPNLALTMSVMSLTFFIGSFSIQHEAILKRQMRFKELSFIDILSVTIGNTVGVLAAYNSFGYWALVIAAIATYLVRVCLAWWLVAWVPSFFRRNSGVRPMLGFGANLTGANFVGYLANNVLPFSIGLLGGASFLGFYDRAFKVASIPKAQALMPVMKVIQSAMVRVANDPPRLRKYALSLMSKVAIVTMLISLMMYLSADWIILLMLGDSWAEAVPVFKILAIATVAEPITTFTAITLIAVGEAKALLKWKIVSLVILLFSILIGTYWGIWGVLWSTTLFMLFVRMPLFFIYSTKFLPVNALEFGKVVFVPLIISVFIAILANFINQYFEINSLISAIIFYFMVVPCLFVLICLMFSYTRTETLELFDLVKSTLRLKWNK